MKKSLRMITSVLLSAVLTLTAFTGLPFSANAAKSEESVGASITVSETQVVNFFNAKVGSAYPSQRCLAFVADCWNELKATRNSTCCAYNYGNSHIVSTSINNIPIGADVFFGNCGGGPCKTCGSRYYGHIGVYVGNGLFVHATGGTVQRSSITGNWGNKFRGWGFHTNVTVTSSGGDTPTPTPPQDNTASHNPVAASDAIEGHDGYVHVRGWAFDPDNTNHNIFVHVYIGGKAGDANTDSCSITAENSGRSDVDAAYHCGDHHAYYANITTSKTGWQPVYLYAINIESGDNVMFASATVNIGSAASGGAEPISHIDYYSSSEGKIRVAGWVFDPDDLGQSLMVHVYIGGIAGSSNAEAHAICANAYRPDVNNIYNCGNYHGFETDIPTTRVGEQEIHIYAINAGGGINPCICDGQVNIPREKVAPTLDTYYFSNVKQDSYRICAVPKDNVGIKEVKVATWSSESNMSDLKWFTAKNDGNGTYYVDINRGEFSKYGNAEYINDIYAYDFSGNEIGRRIIMDYKIISYTGKCVPEGEYRIVTAINKQRALDVDGNSLLDSANIQIYSNLDNSNQKFRLEYCGDGFYRIVNTNSGKAIDVNGNTYLIRTNVLQYKSVQGAADEEWMLQETDDGYYEIISHCNGLALDVADGVDSNGTNVQVFTPNHSAAQKWKLRRVLKDEMLKKITWKTYSSGLMPSVEMVADENRLTENTDYTLETYSENGKMYAKISGIGNYCDSIIKEFQESQLETIDIDFKLLSSNDLNSKQEVALEINELKNVDGYYWGTNSNYLKNEYVEVSYIELGDLHGYTDRWQTVNQAGTYYATLKLSNGIVSSTKSITFFRSLFNPNGGSVNPQYVITMSGNGFTPPIPKRTGYSFVGWEGTEGNNLQPAELFVPTSSEIFSAKWEKIIDEEPTATEPASETVTAPENKRLRGDINGDGDITITDATVIQRYLAGLEKLTAEQKSAADTNNDNDITINDATQIQKFIANIIHEL